MSNASSFCFARTYSLLRLLLDFSFDRDHSGDAHKLFLFAFLVLVALVEAAVEYLQHARLGDAFVQPAMQDGLPLGLRSYVSLNLGHFLYLGVHGAARRWLELYRLKPTV